MKVTPNLFFNYLKSIFKVWILWLFIIVDLIAVAIHMFSSSIKIPQFLFLAFALFGFIYSGFKVYIEALAKIPPGNSLNENYPIEPDLRVALNEGQSYLFQLYEDRMKYEPNPPYFQTILYYRIENVVQLPFDIIAITTSIDISKPFHFMIPEPHVENSHPLEFPVKLDLGEIFHFTMVGSINTSPLLTDAQIAVDMKKILRNNDDYPIITKIEITDSTGRVFEFSEKSSISLRPLCDLMLNYWKETNKENLLKLAGHNIEKSSLTTVKHEKPDDA